MNDLKIRNAIKMTLNMRISKGFKIISFETNMAHLQRPDGLDVFLKLSDPAELNRIRLEEKPETVIKAVGLVRGLQVSTNYARFYGKDINELKGIEISNLEMDKILREWLITMPKTSTYLGHPPAIGCTFKSYTERYPFKKDPPAEDQGTPVK